MATPPQTVVPTASPAAPQEVPAHPANLRDRYVALYDGQCEICQACVSWLRLLDPKHQATAVPIEAETLARVHPGLQLDGCLRELHVIDPSGKVYRGWDGVAVLARLFPPTFLIGWLGRVPPFRWIGIAGYRFVARNRYAVSKCRGGACRIARPEQVRRTAFFATFWSCYLIGLLLRLPLIVGARSARTRLSGGRAFPHLPPALRLPGGEVVGRISRRHSLRRGSHTVRGTLYRHRL